MLFSKIEDSDILRLAARKLRGETLSEEEDAVIEDGLTERARDLFAGFPVGIYDVEWEEKHFPEDRPFGATSVALYRDEEDGSPFVSFGSVWVAVAKSDSPKDVTVVDGLYLDSWEDAEFDDSCVDDYSFVDPEEADFVKAFLNDVPEEAVETDDVPDGDAG